LIGVAERVPNPNGVEAFIKQASRDMGAVFVRLATRLRTAELKGDELRFQVGALSLARDADAETIRNLRRELSTPHIRVAVDVRNTKAYDDLSFECFELRTQRNTLQQRNEAQAATIGNYQRRDDENNHKLARLGVLMSQATQELSRRQEIINRAHECDRINREQFEKRGVLLQAVNAQCEKGAALLQACNEVNTRLRGDVAARDEEVARLSKLVDSLRASNRRLRTTTLAAAPKAKARK